MKEDCPIGLFMCERKDIYWLESNSNVLHNSTRDQGNAIKNSGGILKAAYRSKLVKARMKIEWLLL